MKLFGQAGWLRYIASLSVFVLLLSFPPPTVGAQLIALRTLPIAESDQFSFFPSGNAAMGGVRIALPDSLHDPFVNPASGARLQHSLFFSAPTLFSVSGDAGRGRTFPIGTLANRGRWFGGAVLALQEVDEARPFGAIVSEGFGVAAPITSNRSRSNQYGLAMLGRTLSASGVSLAASAFYSDLAAVDGTNLRYAGSRGVLQSGRATDVRLGLTKNWDEGRSFEALLLRRSASSSHDVAYGDPHWDPIGRRIVVVDRMAYERDRNSTWGMHLEYATPIGDSGWRAGVILTANRIDAPSRPAYEIEAIPGSRGRASAFNVGVGVARSLGGTTMGADAIYEPIWASIWDVSDSAMTNAGSAIRAGDKTLDSRLRFSNAIIRTGIGHAIALGTDTKLQLQLGLQARSMNYAFDRRDLLHGSSQSGNNGWTEWTRSWGARLRLPTVELHYRGATMTGASRAGFPQLDPRVLAAPDIIGLPPAPGQPTTTLRDVSVITHQFSISLVTR